MKVKLVTALGMSVALAIVFALLKKRRNTDRSSIGSGSSGSLNGQGQHDVSEPATVD